MYIGEYGMTWLMIYLNRIYYIKGQEISPQLLLENIDFYLTYHSKGIFERVLGLYLRFSMLWYFNAFLTTHITFRKKTTHTIAFMWLLH